MKGWAPLSFKAYPWHHVIMSNHVSFTPFHEFELSDPTLHKTDAGFEIRGGLPQPHHLGIIEINLDTMDVRWLDLDQWDGNSTERRREQLNGEALKSLIEYYIPHFSEIAPVWTRWD